MLKEDYELFMQLVNAASFKGDKAEYVVGVKERIVKEIEEKGSEQVGVHTR